MSNAAGKEGVQARDYIRMGATCEIGGRFTVWVRIPKRNSPDEGREIELDFNHVPFVCSTEKFDQHNFPNILRLWLHVWSDEGESPAKRLLDSLTIIINQQKRNTLINGDDRPVADLSSTPILAMGELVHGRDLKTGWRYIGVALIVDRSAVSPTQPLPI